MTTVTVSQTAARRPAPGAPPCRPVWEREQLFLEPAYADGEPYGEEDDPEESVIVP